MSRIVTLGPHIFDDHDQVQYRGRNLIGWDGTTGTSGTLTQKTAQGGAWRSPNPQRTARTLVLIATIEAPDEATMQAEIDDVNDACSLDEVTLQVADSAGTRWTPVSISDAPTWTPTTSSLVKSLSVQLGAADWRKFADPLEAVTNLPEAVGGLTVPFTVPFTVPATRTAGTVDLTSPGRENGPVIVRVDGPCTAPVITHTQTGRRVALSADAVLAAGEFLVVDMENELVLAQGESSRAAWVVDDGWSQFAPGDNTWTFEAAAYNSLAQMTVTAWPAWL